MIIKNLNKGKFLIITLTNVFIKGIPIEIIPKSINNDITHPLNQPITLDE